ncbi:hypothetical protein AGOR_G00121850 [Albula goreensis]|uniref:FXYD domain-containing ion transport regulator n=1 Tax=Albula goreensis TaxID=1534307 RepID=A0A8T3DE65_9TELE|nr:hypothetical protein AGOR_G00121850 [Albula goreensis]
MGRFLHSNNTRTNAFRRPPRDDIRPLRLRRHTDGQITMSSGGAPEIDPDADFVYDYHTLRVGGLTFAGVIVFLSIILLAGNSIRRCGKSKPRPKDEEE